ncbi:GNAT family N-acetyltransferase [Paenibacillus aurantiacus]|uniref:GNAT family N-acetyltransferase n=1 Tax=Paenibacillus aurantiacus TaxID=1936118 RepID=A0ABV5KRK6_9BACL
MTIQFSAFDITLPQNAQQVKALQQASYPLEAKLLGLDSIPPMHDTEESLIACGEQFIGCFEGERLVGAVSYKLEANTLDIHRMMVHPERMRRGIAQSLIQEALSTPGAAQAIIATGTANTPAVRLYEKNGFTETERVAIAPGVTITRFEKALN